MTLQRLQQALTFFRLYYPNDTSVRFGSGSTGSTVWILPNEDVDILPRDKAILEELGFLWSPEGKGWYAAL